MLVHAAAAFDRGALAELDLATWRRVQAVNVESALWLAQALAPGMAQRGFGRIVFIVSDTVWDPPAADLLPYVASKAALIGVARSLARSLGRDRDHRQLRRPRPDADTSRRAPTPAEAFAAVRARQAIDRDLVARGRRRRGGVPRLRRRRRDHRADAVRRRRSGSALSSRAVGDQVGAEAPVGIAAGPDLLPAARSARRDRKRSEPASEVGVAEVDALAELAPARAV